MSYELYHEQLRYTERPYSWELIPARPKESQYRIRDKNDNACGHATTSKDAQKAVDYLNSR